MPGPVGAVRSFPNLALPILTLTGVRCITAVKPQEEGGIRSGDIGASSLWLGSPLELRTEEKFLVNRGAFLGSLVPRAAGLSLPSTQTCRFSQGSCIPGPRKLGL